SAGTLETPFMLEDQEFMGIDNQGPPAPAARGPSRSPDASPDAGPETAASEAPARSKKPFIRVATVLGLILAVGAGTYYGHYWWTTGRYFVSTDDAYVGAKSATLSPKVSGY